jgi:hypothetical protein
MWLAALALVLLVPAAPADDRGAVEATLRGLEAEWIGVYRSHDLAVLDRLIAADFVGTLADGSMRGKQAHIDSYKVDFETVAGVTSDEVVVHVFGPDVAVVTGRYAPTLKHPGVVPGRFRYTDTWVRRGGRWQCVATHENALAPE